MQRVRLVVYSDYLCPWCYNASVRLERLRDRFGGRVELVWRSFLLRPHANGPARSLDAFKSYTRSWLRPAAEDDAGSFQVWQGDAGPPSHSVPPQVVAKAAAEIGEDAFQRIHDGLLRAYFTESRDITDEGTLRAVWREAGLDDLEFERASDPALLRRTLAEHQEALDLGITGVPAALLEGQDAFLIGAQPYALYERWMRRTLGEL